MLTLTSEGSARTKEDTKQVFRHIFSTNTCLDNKYQAGLSLKL